MTEDYSQDVLDCAENAANLTNNVSSDPWKYISCFRGQQTQDLEIAISVTVINAIIFVTGLLGNIAVCIVIIKHRTLHSPTNYYLLNLSLSDLTLLIFGLPYDISLYWYQYPWLFGEFVCQARALISETASYVSVLTVVAFSTERHLAICHPLYKLAISSLQRAIRIIIALWILSFLFAFPFAIYSGVHYITYPLRSDNILPESAFCAMISQPKNIPLTELSTLIFFIIPMIIILYQYIKMGIVIRRTTSNEGGLGKGVHGSVHRKNKKYQAHSKNVVKMLSCVVVGFFGCWFPFHAQRLVSIYLREYKFFDELNYWMYFITGIFYYFSSTLNPILYNVMSDRMRNAFKEVFCGVEPERRVINFSNCLTKDTSHIYISNQNSTTTNDDEERLQLVKREQIIVFTPKLRSKMIYEISEEYESKDMCKKYDTKDKCNKRCETCM